MAGVEMGMEVVVATLATLGPQDDSDTRLAPPSLARSRYRLSGSISMFVFSVPRAEGAGGVSRGGVSLSLSVSQERGDGVSSGQRTLSHAASPPWTPIERQPQIL